MPANAELPVTLLVVHWNRPRECLATVNAFRAQGVSRVVVVDNHSTPEALRELEAGLDPTVQIMPLPENRGWGPALNVALAKWLETGRDPFCLISAHDAVLETDCVALLIQAAQSDQRIGVACPQYPDATVPRLSARRGVAQDFGQALARGTAQTVDVPHGTLMLVRRECLAEIGMFDERYFAYGDEHELGARATRRGWKVVLVWGAVVINPGTWTASPLRSYLFTRNSLLLVHDYFGSAAALLRVLLLLGNTLKLLAFSPDQAFAFSPTARLRGVLDYLRGRFGQPNLRTR